MEFIFCVIPLAFILFLVIYFFDRDFFEKDKFQTTNYRNSQTYQDQSIGFEDDYSCYEEEEEYRSDEDDYYNHLVDIYDSRE